jgi:hypothetical protein
LSLGDVNVGGSRYDAEQHGERSSGGARPIANATSVATSEGADGESAIARIRDGALVDVHA